MAQYAVLIYAGDSAHAPEATPDDLRECDDHADNLTGGDIVTDGPFLDSKEGVAGMYIIEAPDLEAALVIARTNPVVREDGGVEVRPLHSSYLRPGGPPRRRSARPSLERWRARSSTTAS